MSKISAIDVEEHVRALHDPEDLDSGDLIERIYQASGYQKVEVDLSQLDESEWSSSLGKVIEYQIRVPRTCPTIVLHQYPDGDFTIVDGTHRVAAMKALGETKIWAYVGRVR